MPFLFFLSCCLKREVIMYEELIQKFINYEIYGDKMNELLLIFKSSIAKAFYRFYNEVLEVKKTILFPETLLGLTSLTIAIDFSGTDCFSC